MFVLFSVETGEKPEKESPSSEMEEPKKTPKSAAKKEKKLKREVGFQIWTELETQRNKFMVTNFQFFICIEFSALLKENLLIHPITIISSL